MEYDGKKALRDAKEAIKNKDFNSALELCKVGTRGLLVLTFTGQLISPVYITVNTEE
jgi:hypothetical protein